MLTKCPECNHEVSDKAEACPECGYPFPRRIVAFYKRVTKKNNLEYFGFWNPSDPVLSYMKLGILAVAIGLIIYGAIFNADIIAIGAILFFLVILIIVGEYGVIVGYPFYWGFRYLPPRVIKYRVLRRKSRKKRIPPNKIKKPQIHDDPDADDPDDDADAEDSDDDSLHNSQLLEPLTPPDISNC